MSGDREDARISSITITPTTYDNFSTASFSLKIPDGVTHPRYILVLVPGFNGSGDRFLTDAAWLAFAARTEAAMVACTFKSMSKEDPNYVHYAAAQHGTGAALENAIVQLDGTDGRYALQDLPLLMYGHSAGGQFAYGFSCHNPKRMLGFAAVKGGYYFSVPMDGTYDVPALLVSGHKDKERRRKGIRDLYEAHRAQGAPWCRLEDANGHGENDVLSVAISYLDALLAQQLGTEPGAMPDRTTLTGVTVGLVEKTVIAENVAAVAAGTDPMRGWLPSKNVFKQWSQQDNGALKYSSSKNSE